MIAATLMWSIAGVVTRHLDSARSFEVTFWRSAFNALALLAMLMWLRGPAALEIVEGATHLFEEPGALSEVSELAADWFETHLKRPPHA